MMKRPIPSSGEMVPVIGMGTSGSFEITPGGPEYEALKEVLKRFFDGGATLIDTAPTYSNAEDVLGPLLADAKLRPKAFIATKLSGVTGRAMAGHVGWEFGGAAVARRLRVDVRDRV